MTMRTVAVWTLAALVGLVLAAAVTIAASRLSTQHVGLSGEPVTVGDELVPKSSTRTTPTRTLPDRDDGETGEGDD